MVLNSGPPRVAAKGSITLRRSFGTRASIVRPHLDGVTDNVSRQDSGESAICLVHAGGSVVTRIGQRLPPDNQCASNRLLEDRGALLAALKAR